MPTKIEIDINEDNKSISLDQIVDMVMDKAETEPKPSQFEYVKEHDQSVMTEIKNFARHVRKPEFKDISDRQLEDVAENQSSDLIEAVYQANIAYLKHGIRLGARIILELLC